MISYLAKKHPRSVVTSHMPVSEEFDSTVRVLAEQTSTLFIDSLFFASLCIDKQVHMTMDRLVGLFISRIVSLVKDRPNLVNIYFALDLKHARYPKHLNYEFLLADVFLDGDFPLGTDITGAEDHPYHELARESTRPVFFSVLFSRLMPLMKSQLREHLGGRAHATNIQVLFPIFKTFSFDTGIDTAMDMLHYNVLRFPGLDGDAVESMSVDCLGLGLTENQLSFVMNIVASAKPVGHALEVFSRDDNCALAVIMHEALNPGTQTIMWVERRVVISLSGVFAGSREDAVSFAFRWTSLNYIFSGLLDPVERNMDIDLPIVLSDKKATVNKEVFARFVYRVTRAELLLLSIEIGDSDDPMKLLHAYYSAHVSGLKLGKKAADEDKYEENQSAQGEEEPPSSPPLPPSSLPSLSPPADFDLIPISRGREAIRPYPLIFYLHPLNITRLMLRASWSLSGIVNSGENGHETALLSSIGAFVDTGTEVLGEDALFYADAVSRVIDCTVEFRGVSRVKLRSIETLVTECPIYWGAAVHIPYSDTGHVQMSIDPSKFTDDDRKLFDVLKTLPLRAGPFCADKISFLNKVRPSWLEAFVDEMCAWSDYPNTACNEALVLLYIHAQTIMFANKNIADVSERNFMLFQTSALDPASPFKNYTYENHSAYIFNSQKQDINAVVKTVPVNSDNISKRRAVISFVSQVCEYAYLRLEHDERDTRWRSFCGIWTETMELAWTSALRYKIHQSLGLQSTRRVPTLTMAQMEEKNPMQTWLFAYYHYVRPSGISADDETTFRHILDTGNASDIINGLNTGVPLLNGMHATITRAAVYVYMLNWDELHAGHYVDYVTHSDGSSKRVGLKKNQSEPRLVVTMEHGDVPIHFYIVQTSRNKKK